MSASDLVDEGDAIWLVWREVRKPPQLYPCKVKTITHASSESASVFLLFHQDNGIYEEPSEIVLRRQAMYDEAAIRSTSRAHLDWGYRLKKTAGEQDFRRSAHASSAATGDTRQSQEPSPRTAAAAAGGKRTREGESDTLDRLRRVETCLSSLESGLSDLRGDLVVLRGKMDAWDRTVDRMGEYQRSHAMLQEEVRRLKRSTGLDAAPTDPAAGPSDDPPPSSSASDPLCTACKKYVAFDAPMSGFLKHLSGGDKMVLSDLFTLPGGRVKAASAAKKLVRCSECMPAGALRLVVCASGGSGGRKQCDWCRCIFTTQTTDAASGWCGSKHSSCRTLVIENETNRQGNTQFLAKGIATVAAVVPWDEVKLIDVGLEQYNDADYVIVAKSTLGKALVILEIDNRGHAGGGIYSPAAEKQKNDGNFAAGNGFDKVLFLRVNPSGQYTTSEGEASLEKKARWLIVREWIVTFLRYPLGVWAYEKDKTLVYLFYDHDSNLIDKRPEFNTVVAYKPPGLPAPTPPDLADWSCSLDPYLAVKGSALAVEHLVLKDRHPQPTT